MEDKSNISDLMRKGVNRLTSALKRPPVWIAIVLVVIAGVAVGYETFKRPADVSRGEEVAFEPEEQPGATRQPDETTRKKGQNKPKKHDWPMFRFDRARTSFLNVKGVNPPFKRIWRYSDKPLLEFPPVYVNGTLYLIDNDGRAIAFDADTGKKVWQRKIADLNASAPAYSEGILYIANLRPGQLIALNAKNGKTVWRQGLPSRSESSPVVVGNMVYFGAENGSLYALDKRNGREVWSTQLAGEIKAAPAFRDGVLYVGDYGGEMSAVRARNGEIIWQAGSQGLSFSRSGAFYSTPAVAFGRVYVGNNDGRVYSFDAGTGELAWTRSTGDWVYSGPAVAQTKNSPPSVYIGSFDGNIYAFDAQTGETRWSKPVGGPVVGSLSVIGGVVYVATFEPKQTRGFKVANGDQVFSYHTGAYMPVISDGRRIYLTGYSSIHALEPVHRKPKGESKGNARRQRKGSRQNRSRASRSAGRSGPRNARAQPQRRPQGQR